MHDTLIRLTPKRAPFSRGGIHFASLAEIILKSDKITAEQGLRLIREPLVDVDESHDGGETWRRVESRKAPEPTRIVDPARSPERAVDPSGPLVPRAMVPTADGLGAPPSAADPAVPLAGERDTGRDHGRERPVAAGVDSLADDTLVAREGVDREGERPAEERQLSEAEIERNRVAEEVRLANAATDGAPAKPAAHAKAKSAPRG